MKTTKDQNFERGLPDGYKEALYVNAKAAKFGIIFNLIAFAVLAVVMFGAFLALYFKEGLDAATILPKGVGFIIAYFVLFGGMFGYVVLHELVHGIAYKSLTGEKLTFGVSWSCAFCGVPKIYTYRKTAIISVAAPLVTFTVLFIILLPILYIFSALYFLIAAFIFGLHLGGCAGDIYVLYLLTAKFKDEKTLMRDTGPEQYFYIPDDESAESSQSTEQN